jgi:DNA-binding MarR family transcriptional regulator
VDRNERAAGVAVADVAGVLRAGLGTLWRRLLQTKSVAEMSWRESSALSLLISVGPSTGAELARLEQISPQSMGATLKALERQGLIARSADPNDGRRVVLEVTGAGTDAHRTQADVRSAQWIAALATEFSADELELLATASPLLERLAQRMLEVWEATDQPGAEPGRRAI